MSATDAKTAGRKGDTAHARLVDRFIEFGSWTTSRKTTLLLAVALPPHLVFAALFHLGLESDVLEERVLSRVLDLAVVVVLACLLIAAITARSGRDGRWTAYLLMGAYGTWVSVLLVAVGVYVTPFLAYPFMLPLLLGMWFDARVGVIACAFGIVVSVLVWVLTLRGVLPFAPALVERSVDGMRTAGWFATVFVSLLVSVATVYVLAFLTIAVRKEQDLRLHEANDRLSESQRLIRRYVPSQVAAALESPRRNLDGHERRKLTLFFSDIVGFAEIAERMEPEDLSRVLNEYFTEMTIVADRYDGTVDELMGDAILILFGAPLATNDQDHARRAVRMAGEMQEVITRLNEKWGAEGLDEILRVRMGVNTGVVTVGNFGSSGRMKYAALGKHVNVAARLQAQCEPGRVLISHATWLLVHDEVACVPKGEATLKGVQRPVMTYELAART
jgi:class 3 adenylate cyclase